MPQSWGFSAKYFFKYFFLYLSFFLSGALKARVLQPFYCPLTSECVLAAARADHSHRPAFQFAHLSSVISSLLETPSVTFLLLWLYASVLNCHFILLLGCSFLTETSDPSLCFQSVCPYYINHGFWSIFSNNANVCVISALMSVDWLLLYKLSFPYCF